MKLLTINTHSLVEDPDGRKLRDMADFLIHEQPDIIAFQEVNQSMNAPVVASDNVLAETVRSDNYALCLHALLKERGINYHWCWHPMKTGYDRYDEGLAFFTKAEIEKTDILRLSATADYHNWRLRKALGIRCTIHQKPYWFYNVHMGWWNDTEEPFERHFLKLDEHLKKISACVYLMGDFNADAAVRKEGYDLIRRHGWHDCYDMAKEKDDGWTVVGKIDGWKDPERKRIDYIFCSQAYRPDRIYTVLNRQNGPAVSDHFGIMMEDER